jgi:hypothetical protein
MKIRTGIVSGIGFGDSLEELTRITGIKQLANSYEAVTGKSCGCEKRKQALNKIQLPELGIVQ